MQDIQCVFVSADGQSSPHPAPHAAAATFLFESLPWAREVVRAGETGQFPSLMFGGPGRQPTHLTIAGEEGDTFLVMQEVTLKPRLWGIFGRKFAGLYLHDTEPAQVREHIQRFYALDLDALFVWTRSASAS